MFGAVFCVLCLATLPIYVTSQFFSPDDERVDWEKIVGGTKAANGSAPYQVSLRVSGNRHFCGASIITPNVMLTAAHCVDRLKVNQYTAVVGTNQLDAGGESYNIRKAVYHEKYDRKRILNDIAVIFTDRDIQFGPAIDMVELNNEPVAPGEKLRLTGWGITSYPGVSPNDLMELEVTAVSHEVCKRRLGVTEMQICAVGGAGQGACHADSGGPLVREGRQVGIVSYGIPCATGTPDVYTKVQAYIDWIVKHIQDDKEDRGSRTFYTSQAAKQNYEFQLDAVN